jgi:hypothetical protein
MLNYSIINANGTACVTLFVPGSPTPIYTADDTNPAFTDIVAALLEGQKSADEIAPLFDPETAAKAKFERTSVSERISVKDGQVYFDQEPVDSGLTRMMVRMMDEGIGDWEGLARFFEKVQTNPNEHSRVQLFEWLRRHDLAINSEGDAIFYKGVQANPDGTFVSVHAGPAIVNGVEVNGQVPNNPGDVVEMDASQVEHNPSVGCASGLHVANWRYANSWARGAVLKVLVNPRDVRSVPTDCNAEKVRCSRYKVIEVIDAPVNTSYLPLDGVDTPDLAGDPADFDLDVSGGVGVGATARMGMTAPQATPQTSTRPSPLGSAPVEKIEKRRTLNKGDRVKFATNAYSEVKTGSYGTVVKSVVLDSKYKLADVLADDYVKSTGQNEPLSFWKYEIEGVVVNPGSSARSFATQTQADNRTPVGGRSDGRSHGKGGATSLAAKGTGRNPAQDAKGRFSSGRPGSKRDPKTGRFGG